MNRTFQSLLSLSALTLILCSRALSAPADCQLTYHFTNRANDTGKPGQIVVTGIPGASPGYMNILSGCAAWTLSYNSEGFSALSIELDSAPNTISGGVATPGSYAAFAGTAVTGSNPSTVTTSASYNGTGYFPWLQVNLTSFTGTGTIDVVLSGWKSNAYVANAVPINRIGPTITPATDSTTAFKFTKADGVTSVLTLDTSGNIVTAAGTLGGGATLQLNGGQNFFATAAVISGRALTTIGWAPSTNASTAPDTAFSRLGVNKVGCGNGTQGDSSCYFQSAGYTSTGTKFTASGCSNSTTVGGATAGKYTSGTTGTCTVVVTVNGATGLTAPNGWSCWANDETTPANKITETTSNATTVTLSGTTTTGDVIDFGCLSF